METPSKLKEWEAEQNQSKLNVPLPANADFNGPVGLRRCTDVPCLLLFLVANVALAGIASYVFTFGDPNRLVTGWDFRGELCGVMGLSSRKYTYFPAPLDTMELALCLEGCPVLVAKNAACMYAPNHTSDDSSGVCYTAYPSKPYFNKYCLPADPVYRSQVLEALYSPDSVFTRTVGDIYRAWDVLVLAGLVPCLLAMSFILWMYLSRAVMWLAIGLMFTLAFALASLAFMAYEESWRIDDRMCSEFHMVTMQKCDASDYTAGYRVFAFTLIGLAGILVLTVVAKVGRLVPGTEYLPISMTPLRSTHWMFIIILEYGLISAVLYTFFLSLVSFSVSCGEIETYPASVPGGHTKSISFEAWTRWIVIFELLMYVWWTSVLVQTCEYLFSAYVSIWFFSKDRSQLQAPMRSALWTLFRYHLGSLVYTSIIIPVLRTPRQVLALVRSCLSHMNQKTEKCGTSLCGCCLECYEFHLKYLNSHTIPYQMIWGTAFNVSSKRGFFLISRGPPHTLVPVHSAEFILWLVQVTLFLSSPIFVYYWILHTSLLLTGEHTKTVTSVAGLAWISAFYSWTVCEIVGGFVRSLLYAQMTSYLVDREMFIGIQRYSDPCLSDIFREEPSSVTLEQNVGAEKQQFTEDSQDDMLADVASSGRKLDRVVLGSSSSQMSIYSDTSDESRYLPGRAVTPQAMTPKPRPAVPSVPGLDTARNLHPPANPTVPLSQRRDLIANMSPDSSINSFQDSDEESEVYREPIARPPTRGDTTSKSRKVEKKSARGAKNL